MRVRNALALMIICTCFLGAEGHSKEGGHKGKDVFHLRTTLPRANGVTLKTNKTICWEMRVFCSNSIDYCQEKAGVYADNFGYQVYDYVYPAVDMAVDLGISPGVIWWRFNILPAVKELLQIAFPDTRINAGLGYPQPPGCEIEQRKTLHQRAILFTKVSADGQRGSTWPKQGSNAADALRRSVLDKCDLKPVEEATETERSSNFTQCDKGKSHKPKPSQRGLDEGVIKGFQESLQKAYKALPKEERADEPVGGFSHRRRLLQSRFYTHRRRLHLTTSKRQPPKHRPKDAVASSQPSVQIPQDTDDAGTAAQPADDAVTGAQAADDAGTVVPATDDAGIGAQATDDAGTVAHAADDAVTVAQAVDDAVTVAQAADDAGTGAQAVDDAVAGAQAVDDAVTVAQATDDAGTVAQATDDAVTGAHATDDAGTVAQAADDAGTVAQATDDAGTGAQATDDAGTGAHATDDAGTVAQAADDAGTVAQAADDAVTVSQATDDAGTGAQATDDAGT
eukprot:726905-Prorocentrum_minimum.AAC.4